MLDLIMGLVIGRNTTKAKTIITEPIIEEEHQIELPKVTGYVHIPELDGVDATLDSCFKDYEETNLVCIHKNGTLTYYLEVEVECTQVMWGEEKILKNI